MVSAANLKVQSYRFQQDTLVGRWQWTTVMDVSGTSPSFKVTDIVSPYGILRDTIPIPGDIVEAMAESIQEIRSQFPPEILVGPPSSVTIEVDEGRGFSLPQSVVLSNVGVFGSLLGASLSSSAAYLTVTPAQLGNLSAQESGSFEVAANSTVLIAANSPYNETVTVQDSNAVNSPQVLAVTIVVRPKAIILSTPTALSFNVAKPLSGAFPAIPTQTFAVQNTGPVGSVLDWQIQKVGTSSWLAGFTPVASTLASGDVATITVSISPPQNTLPGIYTETLRISGYSENQFVDVLITLTVT